LTELYEKNLEELDRLFKEKEKLNSIDLTRYRWWSDELGNRYAWKTHKQEDGKFHAYIQNKRSVSIKKRIFSKRKSAKAWALKKMKQARAVQKIHGIESMKRKEAIQELKPKVTPEQAKKQEIMNKITMLQKRNTSKERRIKTLKTWIKKDTKKIKYYIKRLVK
jgi:hypothetical protein